MEASATAWELDSDEIASIASEDLRENRPNRWTGPKSTWRTLTEEDRLLWQSIKQLQDQNLSVHLYNAFALKRRNRYAESAQDLMVKTADGQDVAWAPPKMWTAWPLKHKQVPKERLINDQPDEDDRFTFRRQEEVLPSTELEEEISATILRTAKRRFRKRKSNMAPHPSIEESGNDTPGGPSRESSMRPETEDEGEKMAIYAEGGKLTSSSGRKTYEPVESTNDELSYQLLRPSVRHILSQLDGTLSILHNSRLAGMSYMSDSSTEEESDSQSGQKRSRSRRRTASHDTDGSAPPTPATPSRRGRPRKIHVPREGETHEEMLLRVARESHRKMPTTPKDKDKDTAFEEWMRKGDEAIQRERSLSLKRGTLEGPGSDVASSASGTYMDRKRARWGLRDWSDVLGAAALAGFSSETIARTARRCADLFEEGMVIRTLNEVPVSQGIGISGVEYRPEPIRLSYSDEDEDADDESDGAADLVQRRVASRQASLARSSRSPDSLGSRRSTRSPAPPKSPRSRSGSAGGLVFCPVASCDRAAQGFTRKANLRRHIELVHQGQTEEVDSDEEVTGGVHVDGFLRPIVPGRGWRGEDTTQRKRKRFYGDRSRETSVNNDDVSP
ncbi:hypothetical protein N0V84_002105 [Fusarium piperis]|uniref:C2H2-type domain-containing protein n=1 Tax=Fusarium piperis TaxID=1435070 RepID=A0A9W9BRY7_9HYPO|nr:hypothetical protein N0V84_002105 [Fusarium piperis]